MAQQNSWEFGWRERCLSVEAASSSSDTTSSQRRRNDDQRHGSSSSATRPTQSRSRQSRRALPSCRTILSTLALASLATPSSAVRVPFDNCLPDRYLNNDPTLLQWDPKAADAKFDTQNGSHNLLVRVWGNVTGTRHQGGLPPAGDPHWDADDEWAGKIIDIPFPDNTPRKATTLARKVNVATFQPWTDRVNFCDDGLVNANCPLGPVFNSTDEVPVEDLPMMNMTHDFEGSYAFTTLENTFLIIYGDPNATNIGCISVSVTPSLGQLAPLFKFLPLAILIFAGLSVVVAGIFSPWGSADVFSWTSNYGRDADLLRLVTPGFGDCLQYIQFITLTGGLSLNYPGFYQPVTSQVAWSSLMFNQSFIADAPAWQSIVDGIYVTDAKYGLQRLAQLVGMGEVQDIWAGMMVWLMVIIAAVLVITQLGFAGQWLYHKINNTTEEDLRSKNIPFSIGNVIRIVFNFFLLPIVALSTFQLVVVSSSPTYTVVLAVITIIVLIGFASWLLWLIINTKPRSVLFDDLPIVLQYGPLYNTYSDGFATFALVPILLTFVRGLAIGAVQPSGIAQVVLLAICEVVQMLTIWAFRPYSSPTSMNSYHTIFSSVRLITILLMVAFTPTLGVTDGPRAWIAYVILLLHACVLVFAFLLASAVTIFEVVARRMGAGEDDVRGLQRGGLNKIFGMRQLSRRMNRGAAPSRASQLSTAGMLDADEAAKGGYMAADGRIRSGSAASMSGLTGFHNRNRNSSRVDSIDLYSPAGHRNLDSGSSYAPGTPAGTSTFSFLPSPTTARGPTIPNAALAASDPFYRPPRKRRDTLGDGEADHQRGSLNLDAHRLSQPPLVADAAEADDEINRDATPAPPQGNAALDIPANQADYATREVDFYYGVRGPALNSEGLGRKLGTGPADPTGPVATATGWLRRNLFGGKSKEKGKGFEVVRSARMPPQMMARNGGFGDETPPEGIPVAMGVLRNGPIDSDDDEPSSATKKKQTQTQTTIPVPPRRELDLLTDDGIDDAESEAPDADRLPRGKGIAGKGPMDDLTLEIPELPRKSSKRNSGLIDPLSPHLPPLETQGPLSVDFARHGSVSSAGGAPPSHHTSSSHHRPAGLPFDRTASQKAQKRLSSNESVVDFPEGLTREDFGARIDERPASFGRVPKHEIRREEGVRDVDLLGSEAEVVDEMGRPTRRAA